MVTSIACPIDNSDMIVSSSRDKSILVWTLSKQEGSYGVPKRRLTGHNHSVEDVALSFDAQFALSGSCDGELRLWDLNTGVTTLRFIGHTKGVLSVSYSTDNSQIVSASRDCSIKVWNTQGECSCLRWCYPFTKYLKIFQPIIVSASSDKTVKLWNMTNCMLRYTFIGHGGYVNIVVVSPNGTLCASGGKDGVTLLWNLDEGKRCESVEFGGIIHALCFSPNRYWLCAATEEGVKIWDLVSKSCVHILKLEPESGKNKRFYCSSMNWSSDGSTLFTGYTDGVIRVWSF
ncbi:hypothetical protein MKW92_026459 [Papaver armeniacum]|nr:hypothetical protein MKW92_026459 [Papaver armeniacum]